MDMTALTIKNMGFLLKLKFYKVLSKTWNSLKPMMLIESIRQNCS